MFVLVGPVFAAGAGRQRPERWTGVTQARHARHIETVAHAPPTDHAVSYQMPTQSRTSATDEPSTPRRAAARTAEDAGAAAAGVPDTSPSEPRPAARIRGDS